MMGSTREQTDSEKKRNRNIGRNREETTNAKCRWFETELCHTL